MREWETETPKTINRKREPMSWGVNHQVGIKASPEEIYKALTETEKLAQRRTTDARGSSAKFGDTLELPDNMVNGLGLKTEPIER
jgi:hypothetical protein